MAILGQQRTEYDVSTEQNDEPSLEVFHQGTHMIRALEASLLTTSTCKE